MSGDARGDGHDLGLRLQLFHPSGLPVGTSIVANTTVGNDQMAPSLVPFRDDAFLAAWTDASMVAPDTDASGVRARVLYPRPP